jgi:hypothetical protein
VKNKYIFVGPSAEGICLKPLITQGYTICDPVKRGDLEHLSTKATKVVIVDGYFRTQPSVGHIEIRELLTLGIEVIGICSMGAIRAFEMKDFGMKGLGYVYNCFVKASIDFSDDEVTQLHLPKEHEYVPISEPLVNLRYYIELNKKQIKYSREHIDKVIEGFKSLPYTERKIKDYVDALAKLTNLEKNYIKQDFIDNRIKQKDLLNFIKMEVSYA